MSNPSWVQSLFAGQKVRQSPLSRHRQLAPTASIRVSPLCLGAMNFGEAHKALLGECSKETSFAILDHFCEEGGNYIDTANGYQAGESEKYLGDWMKARENRDQMVIATKYSAPYQISHKDWIQSNFGGNNVKSMKMSVDNSLRNLQTHYIDLLYVHWWDYSTSIPELMHGLNDLVASGKVLYLGISDCPAWVVAKANQYARDHGLRQFVVYQGHWNAASRDFERDIIPMCMDEGMGICPYGTLNSGRFQTEAAFKEREANKIGRTYRIVTELDRSVSKVLEDLANAKGCGLQSVALAYVRHKAPYVFPIIGGRSVETLKKNIESLSVLLTEEEVQKIESAYSFDPGFPHTFLSGTMITQNEPKGAYKSSDVYLLNMLGQFDWVERPGAIKPAQT